MSRFEHVPHPHIAARKAAGPVKTSEQHPHAGAAARFNARVATAVTRGVGTMWCAYAFAAMDLLSLPDSIRGGVSTVIQWVAQTFLQLVLLSVIMVGQNLQAAAADKRAEATYLDAEAVLHEAAQIQTHLAVQDERLAAQDATLAAIVEHLKPASEA